MSSSESGILTRSRKRLRSPRVKLGPTGSVTITTFALGVVVWIVRCAEGRSASDMVRSVNQSKIGRIVSARIWVSAKLLWARAGLTQSRSVSREKWATTSAFERIGSSSFEGKRNSVAVLIKVCLRLRNSVKVTCCSDPINSSDPDKNSTSPGENSSLLYRTSWNISIQ